MPISSINGEPIAPTEGRVSADTLSSGLLDSLLRFNAINLVDMANIESDTQRGVTLTVDSANGTVTASGTATGNILFSVSGRLSGIGKTVKVSGCPSGGANSKYFLGLYDITSGTSSRVDYDVGSGFTATLDQSKVYGIYIYIKSGQSVDLTFTPKAIVEPDEDVLAQIDKGRLASSLANSLMFGCGYLWKMDVPYTDANDIPRNTVYFFSDNLTLSNMPDGVERGWIITYGDGVHTASYSVGLQIIVSQDAAGFPTDTDMYIRSRFGTEASVWSPWKRLADVNKVEVATYGSVSMFESVSGIGDSYMAGSTYVDGSWVHSVAKYSWIGDLSRRNGLEYVNYGAHGGTAYHFINFANGLQAVLDAAQSGNATDLYVINYGINDSNPTTQIGDRTGGPSYIGSSDDINESDPTQNANSFWGCMGRIIQQIKDAAPYSKIVLMTLMRFSPTRYDLFSDAIEEIAEYFNLPVVRMGDDSLFSSSFYTDHIEGNHPTGILYNAISHAFERQLNKSMVTYADYFNDFIGADGV